MQFSYFFALRIFEFSGNKIGIFVSDKSITLVFTDDKFNVYVEMVLKNKNLFYF